MKFPLELYGTDEQAALGAWVLTEANIAPLQHAPVMDLTPRTMIWSGKLKSPNVRHTEIAPSGHFLYSRVCQSKTAVFD